MITLDHLRAICPHTKASRLNIFVDPLNLTFEEFGLDTPELQRRFLAQVAHESGGFVYTRELWGPTPAQARYDTRADLGNTRPEAIDIARQHGTTPGPWWRGHGLIQTTGFDNHRKAGEALALDLLHTPQLLEEPIHAARSAGYFWQSNNLNAIDDFERLTRKINGGINGLADRVAYYERAQEVIA
jgi:putative chitinase